MSEHPFDRLRAKAKYTRHSFVRDIKSEVTSLPEDKVLVVTRLLDEYHDLSVALIIDADLVIEEIACKMDRVPYPVCPETESAYEPLVGLQVYQRGVLKEIRRRIERTAGCTHFTEVIENSLRALFAGLYTVRRQVDLEDVISIEERRQMNIHRPMLADTCRSFRTSDTNDKAFDVALDKIRQAGYEPQALDPHAGT